MFKSGSKRSQGWETYDMNTFRNIWCVYPGHSVPQHEDDRVGPPADQECHGDDRHDESHPPVVARLGPG